MNCLNLIPLYTWKINLHWMIKLFFPFYFGTDNSLIFYHVEGEEEDRQPGQVRALLKTLHLLSSVRVSVYVFNNDDRAFYNILAGVRAWHVETETGLVFHNVKVPVL